MAWIESHQGLAKHPKTLKLARKLNIHIAQAIGHLHLFWWWAMEYAQDGDLSHCDPEDIAIAAEWSGDAVQFVESLVESGFVDRHNDGSLSIHDWHDYAGKLIEQRARNSARKKDMRRAYENGTIDEVKKRDGDRCRYCGVEVDWTDRKGPNGGTYDHIDPEGPSTKENLVVCCRSCNSKKGGRTPEEAGMHLLPVARQTRTKFASNAHQTNHNLNLNQKNNKSIADSDECAKTFDRFWAAYPKKHGKQAAWKKWQSLYKQGKIDIDFILDRLRAYITYVEAERRRGFDRQFLDGSTFVNQERWNDDWDTVKPRDPTDQIIELNRRMRDRNEQPIDWFAAK